MKAKKHETASKKTSVKKRSGQKNEVTPTYQSKLGQFTYNNPSKTPDTQKKDVPAE